MNESEWVKLAAVADIPAGRAKFVAVGDRRLAVFHLSDPDGFVVTDDECPHAGASLAAGEITGRTVTCHWHAWVFDLETGRSAQAEHVTLRRYESRVQDGHVWVVLGARTPRHEAWE